MQISTTLLTILALFTIPVSADAQLEFDTEAVDRVFARFDRDDGPGCAVGIVYEGKLVHARGYGMANLEHDIPLAQDTVLRIGSTSKQFTAACAVLADRQGLLSLDADIREYLPEIPNYGETITVRQLLNHTSGIRDYLELMQLAGYTDFDFYSDAEAYEMLTRQMSLNFDPGSQHLYSNSGYFLISQIILRTTGKTLAEFAEQFIFAPLGMKDTHFHDDHTQVVKRRADGYSRNASGAWRISNTSLEMCGDGGIFTTVEDFVRWDSNFYDPVVGGEGFVEEMEAGGVLDDGTVLIYGLGLMAADYRGLRMVSHGGAFVGFRADAIRFPTERVSVICFANLDAVDPSGLARRVADIVLDGRFTDSSAVRSAAASTSTDSQSKLKSVDLPREMINHFAGSYLDHVQGEVIEIAATDSGLQLGIGAGSFAMLPVSQNKFSSVNSEAVVEFEPASLEGFWNGVLHLDGEILPFGPYLPWDPSFMSIDDYVGSFYCPELNVTWSILNSGGELIAGIEGDDPLSVTPIALDALQSPYGLMVFERDLFREILGYRFNAGRVLGLQFVRRQASHFAK